MTKRNNDTASIFPTTGNSVADQEWATIVAQRHFELWDSGDGKHLMENLHVITGLYATPRKREASVAEMAYLFEAIDGPRRHQR